MCVLVKVRGEWCDTVNELRVAVRCEPVKDSCYKTLPADDHCLCGVDIPATLVAAGLKYSKDEGEALYDAYYEERL